MKKNIFKLFFLLTPLLFLFQKDIRNIIPTANKEPLSEKNCRIESADRIQKLKVWSSVPRYSEIESSSDVINFESPTNFLGFVVSINGSPSVITISFNNLYLG